MHPCKRIAILVFVLVAYVPAMAQKPQLVVESGHTGDVTFTAFSPDGRFMASGSCDHTLKLWDVERRQELRTLPGHTNCITGLAFSPDGKMLVSAEEDNNVKLWDPATGQVLKTLTEGDGIRDLTLAPDGTRIVANGTIWDVATGRVLSTQFCGEAITSAFSPDGSLFASAGFQGTIHLCDSSTGKVLRSIPASQRAVFSLAFSPDGHLLASGADDPNVKIWDVASGNLLRSFVAGELRIREVAYSPDGSTLASLDLMGNLTLWDTATWRERGHEHLEVTGGFAMGHPFAFSPDGAILVWGQGNGTITAMNVNTARSVPGFVGHAIAVQGIGVSPVRGTIALAREDHAITLADLSSGRAFQKLQGHTNGIFSTVFSPDGRTLASSSSDNRTILWDVASGRQILARSGVERTATKVPAGCLQVPGRMAFNPDGNTIASVDVDCAIRLWNAANGQGLREFSGFAKQVQSVEFNPAGSILAAAINDGTVRLWDVSSGRPLTVIPPESQAPLGSLSLAFSIDGKILAYEGVGGNTIKLWDVENSRLLGTLLGHESPIFSMVFSPDGRTLASGSSDNTIRIWDVASGREMKEIRSDNWVTSIAFSSKGDCLIAVEGDGSVTFWDVVRNRFLAAFYLLSPDDWAVVDYEGRFDASPGAMELMHWVVGDQTISLSQLKARYYEPGLLGKVLGLNPEPLRDVSAFAEVKLFPDVSYAPPGPGSNILHIHLANRGGGIGRVEIFVNGKGVARDARDPDVDPHAAEATLAFDLSGSHFKPGEENEIKVITWNQEGYLSSRPYRVTWKPEGRPDNSPAELYAVVAGISQYSSPDLQLEFSAKDAEDFARALEIGADRLFGPQHVHISLLATANDPRAVRPTKENLKQAFNAARRAKPADVLVVYLAGHGVALRDLYAYPTQEASDLDLADPDLRKKTSITSEELTDWLNAIPATHQVMILDTCAAGAAQKKLVEKRDVPSDQIRAIERLKDHTGFYVLMGAAADASSYEASQYGQGLLTYSLLTGMRGAALREEKFVDVSRLFQFAADEVPQLARDIGGVQRPLVTTPQNSASFDLGALNDEDKQLIPFAAVKPMILRPVFMNPDELADNLKLGPALRDRLRNQSYVSSRGGDRSPKTLFIDEEEFPGAIRPSGIYTVKGQEVTVKVSLRRDGKQVRQLEIAGSVQDLQQLVDKIAAAVTAAVIELPARSNRAAQ